LGENGEMEMEWREEEEKGKVEKERSSG